MKILFASLVVGLVLPRPLAYSGEAFECKTTVLFSSQGSIGKAVIEAMRGANERVTVALYGFDNPELGGALLGLAKRKVAVRIKIDTARSAGKKIQKLIEELKAGGVEVQAVAASGRNHNKFAVIDGSTVVTGSYNWTLKAETNWENILILKCPALAQAYEREWEKIR
ncbi:MAG TPA: phospholipase D-like domain-containing protein [Methylomirabilota bacterium]|nr:phospholipase D-like domain-containing protein [Methylomirabilota bacterium]